MNLPHFFIARPRFAAVLSILIVLVGAIAFPTLPISQFPEVAPPTVVVRASYPGATPDVIADTVAAPLEQEINGVEDMLYMSSQSTSDGALAITITFAVGTDLDKAQVLVQNRVAIAEPRLPEEVRRIGVTVNKSSPDLLLVVHLLSPNGTFDQLYISNYAILQVREQLRRIPGVGEVRLFGVREYSMRIWLQPDKLAALEMLPEDVVAALREQNVQVAAGVVGQPPTTTGNPFQLNVSALGRLSEEGEFGEIVVKTGEGGEVVRLRDVARVELGALDSSVVSYLSTIPAVAMPVSQLPGSNALETARRIREAMAEMSQSFPQDLAYDIIYDPTVFIEESVTAVEHTIFEAVALVVLVIMVFLQSWRASVIPLVAIPVSLIGTFACMAALGFSLNNLSLFGLVLAIGIVVDDAIVVVENIERHIENGLPPIEASKVAMNEVSGPIVAVTLVMVAIFVPTGFLAGISGEFYRQFALTIAGSVLISGLVSLTLSPALGAILLQGHHAKPDAFTRGWNFLFGWFFRGFNAAFSNVVHGYTGLVRRLLRLGWLVIAAYACLLGLAWLGFQMVPSGFIPEQDQGYAIVAIQLPDGASLERTDAIVRDIVQRTLAIEGIADIAVFAGFNGATFANAPNAAALFPVFDSFEDRKKSGIRGSEIIAQLRRELGGRQDAFVLVIPPPTIRGVGSGGGFKMMLQDRAGLGSKALEDAASKLTAAAAAEPALAQAFSPFRASTPRLFADVDRVKAKMLNVPLDRVFSAMQIYLGSIFVNELNLFGRTFRVTAQADVPYRDAIDDLGRLHTRNANGQMVPLASLVNVEETTGPERIARYNLYPAAEVQGATAPGYSTGQAIAAMERLARENLPPGISFEWTELAFQEKAAGGTAAPIFLLAVLFVFLLLVAQYENWSLPLAVILTVPLCLVGAIWFVWFRQLDNNVLTQIGLVVLIGLAAKNAILIVEFAKQKEDEGLDIYAAAAEAARLRLRPILMTSFAFILGVVPLVISSGAGAEMRLSLGSAVFGGMLSTTLFGIFFTPVLYVLIRKLTGASRKAPPPQA
ncbi:MAG: multidrug efflux RND transporter permease subunit [Terrimicrobiaceae bacterium]|nr:multidrug efflux RND transporter permease subunit [Terrimicrobiaceae bacterium]